MQYTSSLYDRSRYILKSASSQIVNWRDRWTDPTASAFFRSLRDGGFRPEAHIDVLPRQRLIYVCVPKCASTTIKGALTVLQGQRAAANTIHKRRRSGLRSPAQVGISTFHRIATDPRTLRFSFVRNPYARLVSCWADKLQNKPLVHGDSFVDIYLDHRAEVDAKLPHGADKTLSFEQFVTFATATADARLDGHWNSQDDCIDMPGLTLNFIGKVENFNEDFDHVLDHAGADDALRGSIGKRRNISRHETWQAYYNDALAARVYRAYERDFDRLEYPRAIKARAVA